MASMIPALVILMVAILVIGGVAYDVDEVSEYDDSSHTLTIEMNVREAESYPWDSYASDVRSLVINEGVTSLAPGSLASLTALESVTIPESLESSDGALGVSLKDQFGNPAMEAGEYFGGSGTLYLCDPSIFTYSEEGRGITGLSARGSAAVSLVLPVSNEGLTLNRISIRAFDGNTTIERVISAPGCEITEIGQYAFNACTSLSSVSLPSGLVSINNNAFLGCSSLTSIVLPDTLTSLGINAFFNCTSLASFNIPPSLSVVTSGAFANTGITALSIPSTVTEIQNLAFSRNSGLASVQFEGPVSVAVNAFSYCSAVASLSFSASFADSVLTSGWAPAWTLYETDGTTQVDVNDPSSLAGHRFAGTASALVMQR